MKVVFLDRDGVINQYPGDGKYVTKVKDFKFLPGALNAIKIMSDKGYHLFIISNQAGVAKGVYSRFKLDQITNRMLKDIKKAGGKIRKVFYCTHRAEANCDCRKPKIGSIEKSFHLMRKTAHDNQETFFVGDTKSDIETGHRAGCKTILVLSGRDNQRRSRTWGIKPDYTAKDLLKAIEIIEHEGPYHSRLGGCRAYKSR